MRYIEDTYEAASDATRLTRITMQCDSIFDPIQFSIQLYSTQCDLMQWEKKYDCFYFFGSGRQQIINPLCVFWLLMPRGLFNKNKFIK